MKLKEFHFVILHNVCIALNSNITYDNRYDIKVADGYGGKENATYWNGMVGLVSRQVIFKSFSITKFILK